MAERPRSHHRVPDADLPNAPSPALICRSTAPGSGIQGHPYVDHTGRNGTTEPWRGARAESVENSVVLSITTVVEPLPDTTRMTVATTGNYHSEWGESLLEELGELLNGDAPTRAVNPLALVARPLRADFLFDPTPRVAKQEPSDQIQPSNGDATGVEIRSAMPKARSLTADQDIKQSKGR